MRGNVLRIHRRNDEAYVSNLGGVSAVSTHELITNPVEMSQTGFHDRFAICPRQNAASVTHVEPAIYHLGESWGQ